MIGLVLMSLGFTTLVAFLVSIGFIFIQPSLALAVFFITFAFEWVIMEPLNRILRTKTIKAEGVTFAKMAKYEEAVGKQSVALECEYCSHSNAVKIDLEKSTSFLCTKCGNGNKVVVQFSTVRVTNPVDMIETKKPTEIIDELEHLETEDE